MACNRILIRHAFFSFGRGQAHTIISPQLTQLKCQMPEQQTGDFDELHLDFDAIAKSYRNEFVAVYRLAYG